MERKQVSRIIPSHLPVAGSYLAGPAVAPTNPTANQANNTAHQLQREVITGGPKTSQARRSKETRKSPTTAAPKAKHHRYDENVGL